MNILAPCICYSGPNDWTKFADFFKSMDKYPVDDIGSNNSNFISKFDFFKWALQLIVFSIVQKNNLNNEAVRICAIEV